MILSPDDRSIYFPGIDLEPNALLGWITRAQAIAESPIGANRLLEKQEHITHLEIPASVFFLQNTPIWNDLPISIEQKSSINPHPMHFGYQGIVPHFGYACKHPNYAYRYPSYLASRDIAPIGYSFGSDWQIIERDRYYIEPQSGRVELRYWASTASLKITYTGGYDFSVSAPKSDAIKSAVAAILQWLLYSNGLAGSVGVNSAGESIGGTPVEIDVVDDIKVKWAEPGDDASAIRRAYDDALIFLKSLNKRRVYAT